MARDLLRSLTLTVAVLAALVAPARAQLMEATDGDPVDLSSGLFVRTVEDLVVEGTPPMVFARTYRTRDAESRPFGIGASHSYEMYLYATDPPAYTYIDVILPDGGRLRFDRIAPGTIHAGAVFEHTATPTKFRNSRLAWNGQAFTISLADGTRYDFRPCIVRGGGACSLIRVQDASGDELTLTRDASGDLLRVAGPGSRWIQFTYDAAHRITRAEDHQGRWLTYDYDTAGRLMTVRTARGGLERYAYDAHHRMLSITEPSGRVITNEYDARGWVTRQTVLDPFHFAYTPGPTKAAQTEVRGPDGRLRRVTFNPEGYLLTNTYDAGEPEEVAIEYHRHPTTQVIERVTVTCVRANGAPAAASAPVGKDERYGVVEASLRSTCHRPLVAIDPLKP